MTEGNLIAPLKMKVNLDDIETFNSYKAVNTPLSPLQNQSVGAVRRGGTTV